MAHWDFITDVYDWFYSCPQNFSRPPQPGGAESYEQEVVTQWYWLVLIGIVQDQVFWGWRSLRGVEVSEGCPRSAHEQPRSPARADLAAHVDDSPPRLPWLHQYFASRDLC